MDQHAHIGLHLHKSVNFDFSNIIKLLFILIKKECLDRNQKLKQMTNSNIKECIMEDPQGVI